MYTEEQIDSLQTRLEQQGIRYCIGAYVDIHGVPKAKVVPLDHLAHLAHGSECCTGYALDGLSYAPRDEFILYKTQEWEAYHLSISQWEPARYSHMF
jgi:glutamine synthetase